MSQIDRIARAIGLGAIAVLALTAALSGPMTAPALAQSAKPPGKPAPPTAAEQKAQTSAQSRASLEAGLKSYAGGKHQLATDQLSSALRGGGLASGDMARALYTRGLAYKAMSKPGLAISDLTSALWLKNGLSDTDRASATAQRTEAYKLAGLADQGLGAERAVVADPNPQASIASPAAKPAAAAKSSGPVAKIEAVTPLPPAAPAAASPSEAATSAWSSEASVANTSVSRQSPESEKAQDAARARKLAAQPVESNSLNTGGMTGSRYGDSAPPETAPVYQAAAVAPPTAPAPVAVYQPSPAPAAAVEPVALSGAPSDPGLPNPAPSTGISLGAIPSTVSGFFSNMFGGSTSSESPPAQAAQQVALAEQPSAAPVISAPFTTSSTSVSAANSARAAAPATNSIAAVPPAKTSVSGGKFKLHIAAVRSRADADALAQQIVAKNGGDLANRVPVVDEAVIGSMGTFYRVRVGSYTTPDEPRGVCNRLRSSGFDCLVVTN